MGRVGRGLLGVVIAGSVCLATACDADEAPATATGTDPAITEVVFHQTKAPGALEEGAAKIPDTVAPDAEPGEEKDPKVFYGTPWPTYLPMSTGQVHAVGWFGGCSGLLIKPTWVLSASHCTHLWSGGHFCIGAQASNPNKCIPIKAAHDHPWGDLSVLELAWDAKNSLPSVVPVPLLTEDLHNGWIGKTAEAAGYGTQEDGSMGEREFTAEPIVWLGSDTLTIDGQGEHGVCFGDSGGPVMVIAGDGTVRVAGALSNGDASCVGKDNYTRVDVYRDWIEARTGPTLAPFEPNACGDVDAEGFCSANGGQATWCGPNDTVLTQTCGAGETCGWSEAHQGWRCQTAAAPAPPQGQGPNACGGVTFQGQCDGFVATWCDAQGQLQSKDCAQSGQHCGWVNNDTGYYCKQGCGQLGYFGQCAGSVAQWCDNGAISQKDCGNTGQSCGMVDDEIGYFCLSQACGNLDFFGTCSGSVVQWCNRDGQPETLDCGQYGQSCGILSDALGYYCVGG